MKCHSRGGLGLIALFFTLSTLLAAPANAESVAAPSGECFVEAYTFDAPSKHYSLIRNGSLVIGNQLWIETDCPGNFEGFANGHRIGGGTNESWIATALPPGTTQISVNGDGWKTEYNGLTVWGGQTFADMQVAYWNQTDDRGPSADLTESELVIRELWVGIWTVAVVWFGAVIILNRVAGQIVSKRLCEEVG